MRLLVTADIIEEIRNHVRQASAAQKRFVESAKKGGPPKRTA